MGMTLTEAERKKCVEAFGAEYDMIHFIFKEMDSRVDFMVEIRAKYPSVSYREIFNIWEANHGFRWLECMARILDDIDPIDGLPANGKYAENGKTPKDYGSSVMRKRLGF